MSIISQIESFANLHILVIGDVMVDAYYFGSVDRISPEAPVPIISVSTKELRPGGAANVALNLKSLGAKAESDKSKFTFFGDLRLRQQNEKTNGFDEKRIQPMSISCAN